MMGLPAPEELYKVRCPKVELRTCKHARREEAQSPERLLLEADKCIEQAYLHLNKGDVSLACECAWKATMSALNALAVCLCGGPIKSHNAMRHFVNELRKKEILAISSEWHVAENLHSYFFEPEEVIPRDLVTDALPVIEQLIDKVRGILHDSDTSEVALALPLPTILLQAFAPSPLEIPKTFTSLMIRMFRPLEKSFGEQFLASSQQSYLVSRFLPL